MRRRAQAADGIVERSRIFLINENPFECGPLDASPSRTSPGWIARRDCRRLARLYRAGELVAIRVPSEAEEAVRFAESSPPAETLMAVLPLPKRS